MRFSADDARGGTLGFYVQAGPRIGFGHVSRALALAEVCVRRGRGVRFYSEHDLLAARFFAAAAPRFTRLRNQTSLGAAIRRDRVETLVVDIPRRDERLLSAWGEKVGRLVVIDDWDADCTPADVLVNGHVLWRDEIVRKRRQVRLMGLRYALLKPQWARARPRYRLRKNVRQVLVTFGGSDPQDMAGRLVPVLARRFARVRFVSLLGPGYRGTLNRDRSLPGNVKTIRNVVSIVPLVLRADAAVGAVGVTMYELATMGVPAVLVDPTPGHSIFLDAMDKQGLALRAGNENSVPERLDELVRSATLRRRISETGRFRLDGRGVERVAEHLETSSGVAGHA
ncbi:MAG: hypothetical protein HYT87_00965 [Nitrospirae bacterium]|nr:hypothetical protein [Nitrospirota bacterium]